MRSSGALYKIVHFFDRVAFLVQSTGKAKATDPTITIYFIHHTPGDTVQCGPAVAAAAGL